jgi:hypothetical protein
MNIQAAISSGVMAPPGGELLARVAERFGEIAA